MKAKVETASNVLVTTDEPLTITKKTRVGMTSLTLIESVTKRIGLLFPENVHCIALDALLWCGRSFLPPVYRGVEVVE